jgi:predicted amidohydrolase
MLQALMQDQLRIAMVQTHLHWEQADANRAMLEEMIWGIEGADIIVLPEMFTTGFSMNAEKLAEPMNLHTFKWMQQMAKRTGAALVGSYIVKEAGKFFNRLVWMQPDGVFYTYDKKHLFRMAGEHEAYTPGTERLLISYKGWKICPLICYDLRFPVWSRNTPVAYDLLIYIANWPTPREEAWKLLPRARAIENYCYCVAVNRTGQSPDGMEYRGHSAGIDFKGAVLASAGTENGVFTCTLQLSTLLQYREKFPIHQDADFFELK